MKAICNIPKYWYSYRRNGFLATVKSSYKCLIMPDLDIAQDALLFGEEFVLDSHMSNNMETLLDPGH